MSLDKSGILLEEMRLGGSNNPFNYPPGNYVDSSSAFNSRTERADYCILAGSYNTSVYGADIAHPDLVFFWTKNEGGLSRFDHDGFRQKWLPSPGSFPSKLGKINSSLSVPIPLTTISDSPISIYIGESERIQTFTIVYVDSDSELTTTPGKGKVQVSLQSGRISFDELDSLQYADEDVYHQRQNFFDRTKFNGLIGNLPVNYEDEYFIYLNPLPNTGQIPRVRIDYRKYLEPIEVNNESLLIGVSTGTFKWAKNTGRVKFSTSDVLSYLGKNVYYDGVHNGSFELEKHIMGPLSVGYPSPSFQFNDFVGLSSLTKFVIYANKNENRSYFPIGLFNSSNPPSRPPKRGNCYINSDTGDVYFNRSDISKFSGWTFKFLDAAYVIDGGVAVKFYRSSVNGSGESSVDDFTIIYGVEDQILSNSIGAFPFVQLPTVPVVNSNLKYKVSRGSSSSGTFSGELINNEDPDQLGFGYTLNLDSKQFQFSNRKEVDIIIPNSSPSIKLADGVISEFGFRAERNGSSLEAETDFSLDTSSGAVRFLKSIGENNPDNIFGLSGSVSLKRTFNSSENLFNSTWEGRPIIISDGPNVGLYIIEKVLDSDSCLVDADFLEDGPVTAAIKTTSELIAGNFWISLSEAYGNFSVSSADSVDGDFQVLDSSEFTVFETNGQVNLKNGTYPGKVYESSYFYFKPNTDGTTSSTAKTEKVSFRVRRDQGSTVVGSNKVQFNVDGLTVDTSKEITVYVNGITQDPKTVEFKSPNTVVLKDPITTGQNVFLNYWVFEASGGESSFQLSSSPINLDRIRIKSGFGSITLDKAYLDVMHGGTVFLVKDSGEVLIVSSAKLENGKARITFESTSTFDSGSSDILYSSDSIYGTRRVTTTDLVKGNATEMKFSGDVTFKFRTGTIISIDNDPFLVVSSIYDEEDDETSVKISVRTRKTYIDPEIKYSSFPVLFPTDTLQTKHQANVSQDFNIMKMGDEREILIRGVDFQVYDGGVIKLSFLASGRDKIYATYVADDYQPVGTEFKFNYSYIISPNDTNGISGQRLTSSYDLYSPDSYYFRVETLETFLPEVQDLLKQGTQSAGSYGPNTNDAVGRTMKDEGVPGLFFREQHLNNLDFSIIRLLKFYNDIVNLYEDILSNIDGRLVGGKHGRFRFDGITNNPFRDSYTDITNDIDDVVKLYSVRKLVSFFSFSSVPVYAKMSNSNSISRIYPTAESTTCAINNLVGTGNKGETLGTINNKDLSSVGNFVSTPASALVETFINDGSNVKAVVVENGNTDNLVPPFEPGQPVALYSSDGVQETTGTVVSATSSVVTIDTNTSLFSGSIARIISDPDDASVSRYTTGTDVGVRNETGEVINISTKDSVPIIGNELLDITYSFLNTSTTPRILPGLFGSTKNDYGYFNVPRKRRLGETLLYAKELEHIDTFVKADVFAANLSIISTVRQAVVGEYFRFLNGPNALEFRKITAVIQTQPIGIYQVETPFSAESIGYDAEKLLNDNSSIFNTLSAERGILNNNIADNTGSVPKIDSQLKTADSLVRCIGDALGSGTGEVVSEYSFSDPSVNFIGLDVTDQSYIYIPSGSNLGIYKVKTVSANQLEIESHSSDPDSPWQPFPVIGAGNGYTIINIEPLFTSVGYEFLSPFIRKTKEFYDSTLTWNSNVNMLNAPPRRTAISDRSDDLEVFIESIEDILQNTESLYETRYLWIKQRVDKEDGLLTQRDQATDQRVKSTAKLLENQKKLLITQKL